MSGGSETMRAWPSTSCVSFEKAFMLSFVRAFASVCAILWACFVAWRRRSSSSSPAASSREYQSSRLLIVANRRIDSR